MTQEDKALIIVIAVGCLLGYLIGLCVAVVARWFFGWKRSPSTMWPRKYK